MSLINKKTGYRGFTLDGGSAYPIDSQGRVKKCIVVINYNHHAVDVDFTISNGANDWAAQMGDNSIIPLSNPVVLYKSKNNAVVTFDMANPYPSNSPMLLLYRSDTATFSVIDSNNVRPFSPNLATGSFAFTSNRSSDGLDNGYVNKLVATFQYQNQLANVDFTISNGNDHWAARMGDGSIINLRNPEILSVDINSAMVRFTMDTSYPSNSPCLLLYRSADAKYVITPTNAPVTYISVTDIVGLPTEGIDTIPINLTCAEIKPYNATEKDITWSIVSGNGSIVNGIYTPNGSGTVKLKATINKAVNNTSAFTKTFTINITKNVINIEKQPDTDWILYKGSIAETINLFAKSTTGAISYQWYSNTTNSTSGGTAIDGAIQNEYALPTNLSPSGNNSEDTFYYYCKITSPGADPVYSRVVKIRVRIRLLGITITPRPETINLESGANLSVVFNPTNAYDAGRPVVWGTSNGNAVKIDENGKITGVNIGSSTISVISESGLKDSFNINAVETFVPVTGISGIPTEIGTNTGYPLSPGVVPATATNKSVSVSILPQTSAPYTFKNGVLTCTGKGYVYIKCTIQNGYSRSTAFTRTFAIRVVDTYQFVPVTNIKLTKPASLNGLPMGELYILTGVVEPSNASNKNITFSVVSGSATISSNVLRINGTGNIVIRGTVTNGAGTGSNYTKDFVITATNKFVAVNSARFDYVENSVHTDIIRKYTSGSDITLPIVVNPTDAMPKTYTFAIARVQSGAMIDDFSDDYHTISTWNTSTLGIFSIVNNKLRIDTTKIEFNTVYKVFITIRITNGLAVGTDFVTEQMISVVGRTGIGYIPVEDVDWNFPTHVRTFYPLIPQYVRPLPLIATDVDNARGRFKDNTVGLDGNGNPLEDKFISATSQSADDYANNRVNMDCYIPDGFMLNQSAPPRSIFLWGIPYKYIVPQNPGKFTLTIRAKSCTVADVGNYDLENPTKIDFVKSTEVTVKDPYIPIKNITNIPASIQSGVEYFLCPFFDTGRGMDVDNPYWDDEVPTYTAMELEILGGGSAVVNNARKSIKASSTSGTLQLKITVRSGKQEALNWYNMSGNADGGPDKQIDYTQTFNISIAASPNPGGGYATLTLNTGATVAITRGCDFAQLCNDLGPEELITTSTGAQFKKSQITKVTFASGIPAGTSLDNFGRNFINLTTLENYAAAISSSRSTLRNFLRGCTSFNQALDFSAGPNAAYAYQYCLRDCVNFNNTIILPSTLEGRSVLHGFLYGCKKFNQTIALPNTIKGEECMKRFLYGCTAYNKPITLPKTIGGFACLFEFMAECSSFNQNLNMPTKLESSAATGGSGRELANFMKNCHNMKSTITMYAEIGNAGVSAQTLSSTKKNSALTQTGVTINIPQESGKVNHFPDKVISTYSVDIWPYTHFTFKDGGAYSEQPASAMDTFGEGVKKYDTSDNQCIRCGVWYEDEESDRTKDVMIPINYQGFSYIDITFIIVANHGNFGSDENKWKKKLTATIDGIQVYKESLNAWEEAILGDGVTQTSVSDPIPVARYYQYKRTYPSSKTGIPIYLTARGLCGDDHEGYTRTWTDIGVYIADATLHN